MNDIKVTSRGGARLSEALPNYILKGIYVLTNSFGSGPWPCETVGSCKYILPRYTREEMGLTSDSGGGWEHTCVTGHPVIRGGGYCRCDSPSGAGVIPTSSSTCAQDKATTNNSTVEFSHYKSSYSTCETNADGSLKYECWAHPYMGRIPAPGSYVKDFATGGNLYAGDEGYCPDGYQAVLTITPTLFESGKVISYNAQSLPGNATMQYNPGYMDYTGAGMRNATAIVQPATQVGMVVQPVGRANGDYAIIEGWDVAMGTITPDSSAVGNFIWNVGGVMANSWSATAHTYCYFNPDRFTMPNMQIDESKQRGSSNNNVITPMDNPALNQSWMK